jgi:hypothetical protein
MLYLMLYLFSYLTAFLLIKKHHTIIIKIMKMRHLGSFVPDTRNMFQGKRQKVATAVINRAYHSDVQVRARKQIQVYLGNVPECT